jgi:AmmeMemoRadiSam system protein B
VIWYAELERPRLRPVEALPLEHDGEVIVGLRDPMGLGQDGVAVPLPVFFLVTQMSGVASVEQIATAFERQFGVAIPAEKLRQIVLQLDEAHLLESEKFRRHREERLHDYRAAPARPMAHVGAGYPTDPEQLRRLLDSQFTAKGGPGRAPVPGSGPEVKVVIAPHIDFARGGPNYAWAYQALGDGPVPETVVVLGLSHAPIAPPFVLTRQAFDTPLGRVPVDVEFIDALQSRLDIDLFEDELVHVTEHSVEFQVLWLRHLYPDASELRIVPILCGSLPEDAWSAGALAGTAWDRAVSALAETIASWPRHVTIIGGADLSHVGTHFGDPEPATEQRLAEVLRLDHEALRHAADGDADGFLHSFETDGNARRVCSISVIHAALRCLPALGVQRGRLLSHMQSVHAGGEVVVSHAAMAFP